MIHLRATDHLKDGIQVIAVIFAIALLVAACGGPSARAGVVINKDHRDAYDSPYTYCAWYNSGYTDSRGYYHSGSCGMWATGWTHHPERWTITIQDCREETEGVDDKVVEPDDVWTFTRIEGCITGTIQVGEDWDGWDIGDWYGEGEPDKPCELRQESC